MSATQNQIDQWSKATTPKEQVEFLLELTNKAARAPAKSPPVALVQPDLSLLSTKVDVDHAIEMVRKDVEIVRKDMTLIEQRLDAKIDLVRKDVSQAEERLTGKLSTVEGQLKILIWMMGLLGVGTFFSQLLFKH